MLTVIIPAHKARAHLPNTIGSYPTPDVAPWLQTIVVINGADDGSKSWLNTYHPHIQVIEHPIANVALARQMGLSYAKTPYVAFRDADDTILQGSLETLMHALDARPELSGIGGHMRMVKDGVTLQEYWYPKGSEELVVENILQIPFLMTTAVFRREHIAPFTFPMYRIGEDWAFLWDAMRHGLRFDTINEIVLNYNRHAYANTANMPEGNDLFDFVTVLRAQILASCNVYLNEQELLDFVNIAPCAFWTLDQVPHWRRFKPEVRRARVRAVFDKILLQNTVLNRDVLAKRLNGIFDQLPSWF